MNNKILAVLIASERTNQRNIDLIAQVQSLAQESKYDIDVLIIGHYSLEYKNSLMPYLINNVYTYQLDDTKYYISDIYSSITTNIIKDIAPSHIIFDSDDASKSLASSLAITLKAGLTADCTNLMFQDNVLIQTRPAYGGNLMASIITIPNHICMASIRVDSFNNNIIVSNLLTNHIDYSNSFTYTLSKINLIKSECIISKNLLQDAKLVFVVGAGILKENIEKIRCIALEYGGQIACTRAVVEKGYLDYSYQVGLSSHSINPQTLVCLGVSGSIQFRAGITRCKSIIAYNNDIDASIFKVAHHSYCCDANILINELYNKIKTKEN